MADKLKYKADHPKRDALIKAGLMEGGPQPVAQAPAKQREERTQAP